MMGKLKRNKERFWLDIAPITIIVFIILLLLSEYSMIIFDPILLKVQSTNSALYVILFYAECITYWIVFALALLIVKRDRPFSEKIAFGKGNNTIAFALVGAAIGFATNGICVLLAWLNKDIYLYLGNDNLFLILISFIAVFIQSSAEELFTRVWLYQHLKRGYKSQYVALIVSSVIFGLLHSFNPNVTFVAILSIILNGLLLSLCIFYFDSFIMCAMIHTLWNYTQNIVFGLPNSGIVLPLSLLKIEAANAKNSFFYDAGFGIEGSFMSIVVLIIACGVMVVVGEKRKSRIIEIE